MIHPTQPEICDELANRFGSYCLDDEYEREAIAAYIHELLVSPNGTRDATDVAQEFPCVIRINSPDDCTFSARNIQEALCRGFPLLRSSEIEVLPLAPRPFRY